MNKSKQITTENWQFSAVDSIQEFYLFIFLLLSCFWRGGGGNPLHGIYRVVLQKPRFKHYASCCIVFSVLSAVCSVCSLTKWQDGSGNLFYSQYSLFIISGYGAFSSTWAAARQISWDKRKVSHEKKVQSTQDGFGKPTWPPFNWCGAPIWRTWLHVKHSLRKSTCVSK